MPQAPTVLVVQDWPAAMTPATAAAYLDVSVSQLVILVREPGSPLRTMNLRPGGNVTYSRTNLDEYIAWRLRVGYEEKKKSA